MVTMQLKLPQMPFKTLSSSTVLLQHFCTFIQTDRGIYATAFAKTLPFQNVISLFLQLARYHFSFKKWFRGHLSKISPEFCLKNINYHFLLWILESLFLFSSPWSFNSTWFGTFMATQGEETHFHDLSICKAC